MKVFAVFLALMTVFVSFMCYSADMMFFTDLQRALKLAAEDCAAAGALAADPAAYGRGMLVIDEAAAEELAFGIMDLAASAPLFRRGTLSMEMTVFDDEKGYDGCRIYGLSGGMPGVVCTLEYTGGDIFRLPFMELRSVSRTAAYGWDDAAASFGR